MRIPVITFHAWRRGSDFASNDHIALEETLRILTEQKIAVVPLTRVVAALRNPFVRWQLPKRALALTCDDGDISEVENERDDRGSVIKSFATILANYKQEQNLLGGATQITSFVIASAEARNQINPQNRLADYWWRAAAASEHFCIGAHSWDHCHPGVDQIAQREQLKGTFSGIDNFTDADKQIRHAAQEINRKIDPYGTSVFAYPYGDANAYLVSEYFPLNRKAHGMVAAFTTEPRPVTRSENRWAMPRYVCGHHYKTDAELRALLRSIW